MAGKHEGKHESRSDAKVALLRRILEGRPDLGKHGERPVSPPRRAVENFVQGMRRIHGGDES